MTSPVLFAHFSVMDILFSRSLSLVPRAAFCALAFLHRNDKLWIWHQLEVSFEQPYAQNKLHHPLCLNFSSQTICCDDKLGEHWMNCWPFDRASIANSGRIINFLSDSIEHRSALHSINVYFPRPKVLESRVIGIFRCNNHNEGYQCQQNAFKQMENSVEYW